MCRRIAAVLKNSVAYGPTGVLRLDRFQTCRPILIRVAVARYSTDATADALRCGLARPFAMLQHKPCFHLRACPYTRCRPSRELPRISKKTVVAAVSAKHSLCRAINTASSTLRRSPETRLTPPPAQSLSLSLSVSLSPKPCRTAARSRARSAAFFVARAAARTAARAALELGDMVLSPRMIQFAPACALLRCMLAIPLQPCK